MSLAQGSVTVAADGTVTGSGATLAVFNTLKAKLGDLSTVPIGNQVTILQGSADLANTIAALIPYITANAVISPGTLVAHVTTQSLGLTPNPNNAATAIVAPASPVDVPVTGAGVIS